MARDALAELGLGGPGIPNNLNVDFGYYVEPAAVGNYVWTDLNGDGVQQDTEPVVEGVAVQMEIAYPDGTKTTLTTVTDANGYYSFPNLLLDEDYNGDGSGPEPSYTISVDLDQDALLALMETQVNTDTGAAVTDVRNDSNEHGGTLAQPVQGQIDTTAIDPVTGEPAIASYDFGYEAALALGGTLWDDSSNDNGVYDNDEEVLDGVTVKLYKANPDGSLGDFVAEKTTNGNGTYLFDDLEAGDYIVVVENYVSATGAQDPDTSAGDTDTGQTDGTGINVQSEPVTLEPHTGSTAEGSEPASERENTLHTTTLSSTQDGRINYHVDLGFTGSPLSVSLAYVYATRDGEMVSFTWETATESGTAGFNLYMAVDGGKSPVTADMIPSSVIDSVEPVAYAYEANVSSDRFYIELLNISGESELRGPFDLGKKYGSSSFSSEESDVDGIHNPLFLPIISAR